MPWRINMEDIIIKIKEASVCFKDFVLEPLSLNIPRGYITCIKGANGAGKSTFLKMILGNFPKMKGQITVNGMDVIKERIQILEKTGVVLDEKIFFENEDAIKNEEYFSPFYKNWDKEIYRSMLKKMNVSPSKNIGNLSKGERAKYQLAFSAAYKPELLVLDEPAAGLDPVFRKDFFKLLQEFVSEYQATILVSDNIEENLDQITDFIITIENGKCTYKEVL